MLVKRLFMTTKVNPSADLDEEALSMIAESTGGSYYRARSQEDLANIYQAINQREPIEQESRTYRPSKALFYWALITSLIFWLFSFLFGRRF